MYRDNIVRDQILQYPREAGCFWLYGIDITPENVKIYFLCIDISVLAFTSVAPSLGFAIPARIFPSPSPPSCTPTIYHKRSSSSSQVSILDNREISPSFFWKIFDNYHADERSIA